MEVIVHQLKTNACKAADSLVVITEQVQVHHLNSQTEFSYINSQKRKEQTILLEKDELRPHLNIDRDCV